MFFYRKSSEDFFLYDFQVMHIRTNGEYQSYPEWGLFYNTLLRFIIEVFLMMQSWFRDTTVLISIL